MIDNFNKKTLIIAREARWFNAEELAEK